MHGDSGWVTIADAQQALIEAAYCSPLCHDKLVMGASHLMFNSMKLVKNGQRKSLRRLSTPSEADPDLKFSTEWLWYFPDNQNQWFEFGKPTGTMDMPTSFTSDDLEKAYVRGESFKRYRRDTFEYQIDFNSMMQRNLTTNKQRPIRRRPKLVSDDEFEKRKREGSGGSGGAGTAGATVAQANTSFNVEMPENWDHGAIDPLSVGFVKCRATWQEAREISTLIVRTAPHVEIESVERIQNPVLWERFARMKSFLERRNGGPVDTRRLFHGTSSSQTERIAKTGLDMRLSGTRVGTRFGHGSYLAAHADHALHYYEGVMFVVRTLVGHYTAGSQDIRVPPDAPSGHPYDSCVDNVDNPSTFVIFDNHQTYPEYIVKLMTENWSL